MYKRIFKTVFDFFVSLIIFIVLSPFFVVIVLILSFANRHSGVFFIQERAGKNGKAFNLMKFKTMNDKRDGDGKLLPDVQRLTKIGKFVRSTSLDEIPQLINVLKGEMSLVGPRPLHMKYLPLYNDEQAQRHNVRPGITGWAQVNGRNSISWEEKFKLDVWYVNNISFMLDIKILLKTVYNVFKREGISSDTSATMEAFRGSGENEETLANEDKEEKEEN